MSADRTQLAGEGFSTCQGTAKRLVRRMVTDPRADARGAVSGTSGADEYCAGPKSRSLVNGN